MCLMMSLMATAVGSALTKLQAKPASQLYETESREERRGGERRGEESILPCTWAAPHGTGRAGRKARHGGLPSMPSVVPVAVAPAAVNLRQSRVGCLSYAH